MARWLLLAIDDDGDVKALVVNDTSNTALPFGDHSDFCHKMDVSELTAIVELPKDEDFRPDVIDTNGDTEVALSFMDI